MLRTSFAARRTFEHLRAGKIKSEALISLGRSVPYLFSYHQKEAVKNPVFYSPFLI